MRNLLTFLYLFIICLELNSQDKILYKEVIKDLKTDYKSLQTTLIIPNIEFNVGIYPTCYDVEDLSKEQCGDIKTSIEKNKKIINVLDKNNFLEELYIDIGNETYEGIKTSNVFKEKDVSLFIQFSFDYGKSGLYQVFVPIKKRNESKKLIKLISDIFEYKTCFKKLKRQI